MIVVQLSENKNYRKYFTRFKIVEGYHTRELHGNNEFQKLVLDEVPGVTEATLQDYSILIVKAPTFTWEEIDEKFLPILHGLNHSIGVPGEAVRYEWGGEEVTQDHVPMLTPVRRSSGSCDCHPPDGE